MTTALVAAIEPDREQAARLSGIVRGRLGAELVLAESVARALAALGERIPDLILTPALMSTRDEAALAERLRDLGPAAAHVQTVTVPRIGGAVAAHASSGIFKKFRRSTPAAPAPDGCEPDVFAQQVSAYLQRARADRSSTAAVEPATPPSIVEAVIHPVVELSLEEPPVDLPLDEISVAPSLDVSEPDSIAIVEPQPIIEPMIFSEPVDGTVAFVHERAPATREGLVEPLAAPSVVEDVALAAPLIEQDVAPSTVAEEVDATPAFEELVVQPTVEALFVQPPIIEEPFVSPSLVEDFADATAVVETIIEPPAIVEPPPVVPIEELATPPATIEPSIESEPVEPSTAEPIAASPAMTMDAPDELFRVDDIDLEFWIAEEPEAAAVDATVIPTAPADDDRFYIAAQDFSEIDMSSLLEGLVLPDNAMAAAPAPSAPKAMATPEPPRAPEPAAAPDRRKLPPKRHVPVHDRAPEPNVARRRGKTPVQDEWGLFDPEQCGFAALVAKLDAVTDDEDAGKRRGTQTRVISYN